MSANAKLLAEVERLLKTPKALLRTLDQQRRFLAEVGLAKSPCPWCDERISFFEAVDEGYTDIGVDAKTCACPKCGKGLTQIVPFMGPPWFWGKRKEGMENG